MGNGCWAAASDGVVVVGLGESGGTEGLGESGGVFGLLDSPGNGNCSAAEAGFLAVGAAGEQGFVVWAVWSGVLAVVWFAGGQGAGAGLCGGAVWAMQEAERRRATWSARVIG